MMGLEPATSGGGVQVTGQENPLIVGFVALVAVMALSVLGLSLRAYVGDMPWEFAGTVMQVSGLHLPR